MAMTKASSEYPDLCDPEQVTLKPSRPFLNHLAANMLDREKAPT